MRACARCELPNTYAATRCVRCGEPLVAELIDSRYMVESELGEGAMGVVYRARDVQLNRPVALKLISSKLARSPAFVERFRREANALAAIRNEHVVQIYTMGMHDGMHFYAMEFVQGRNLDQIVVEHLKHGGRITPYRALTILRQVALGLDAAHQRGLVHRDVKPANIVIEDLTGRPVLLDFGLARSWSRNSKSDTMTAGTPQYMAPELIDPPADEQIGPSADVYSLGCTAMELLTGQPPFLGEGIFAVLRQHMDVEAPLLSSRVPELAMFDAVIARALEKIPSRRYESCAAFARELEECARRVRSSGPLPTITDMPGEMPAEGRRALRILIVDDDPFFLSAAQKAARVAIDDPDLEVVGVTSGVRALTSAINKPPDLVVLDYDMPGANGIDTLSELRAIRRASNATVVVVSASVGAVERWRFSVLGVKDFLAKPVKFEDLCETLHRLAKVNGSSLPDTRPAPTRDLISTPSVRDGKLPPEVFLMLLAVGWADGQLDDTERDAVLAAAEAEGLNPDDLEGLRRASRERVELDTIDVSRLRNHERQYVYAVARWIAMLDGEITEREAAALRVLGFVLRMTLPVQLDIDEMVRVAMEAIPDRENLAMLQALREGVRHGLPGDPQLSI